MTNNIIKSKILKDICFHSTLMEREALKLIKPHSKFEDFSGDKESRYLYWVYQVDEDQIRTLKENKILFIEWVY